VTVTVAINTTIKLFKLQLVCYILINKKGHPNIYLWILGNWKRSKSSYNERKNVNLPCFL